MSADTFISTLGLPKILGISKFTISKRDISNALKIDINNLAKAVISGETLPISETTIKSGDIKDIKESLYSFDLTTLLPEIMPKIASAGADIDVASHIISILEYLKENLPQSEYELTALGPQKTLEASKSDNAKFLWRCRIADNPFYVLQLFVDVMLTNLDVEAFKTMYPDLYSELVGALINSVVETYPSDTAIPRKVKHSLSVFLQVPMITLAQLNAYDISKETDKPQKSAATGTPPNVAQMEQKEG